MMHLELVLLQVVLQSFFELGPPFLGLAHHRLSKSIFILLLHTHLFQLLLAELNEFGAFLWLDLDLYL